MQMKVKNLFKEKKKNVQMNLLNLEQRDWKAKLGIKDKKLQMNQHNVEKTVQPMSISERKY